MSRSIAKEKRFLSNVPWWLCIISCAVSFLVGRNTTLHSDISTMKSSSSMPCPDHPPPLKEIEQLEKKCPVCAPCNTTSSSSSTPDTSSPAEKKPKMEDIFNAEWVSDPKLVYQTINIMCKSIMDTSLKQRPFLIGISTTTFCYQHVLTYKRNYDYAWEVINGTSMGYYTGVEIPPYQMDGWQYSVIHMVLASIPSKNIKMELERSEDEGAVAKFQDGTNNYNKWDPPQNGGRGNSGPRVLFWGCGADTPMHVHLINFLGGKITFIDNSQEFIKICKEWYHDIRLIEPTGTKSNHTQVIRKLVKQDGSSLETDDVNDPLTDSQWIHNLSNVESEEPWDVIVIDGPAENLGRSQPLYMAKRLAQSYGPNHYTHIFLHDAARYDNCIVANAIMGHDPAVYMGNTLPRKGLKHWRVPGRNRPLPPSTKQ